jgi:conjugative relaxase-like TrwC/TraI family protein
VLIAMHGGVKVYRGAAAAARQYVEADRGRVDDYYLAEGTGIAERYTASRDGVVTPEAPLAGDAYEAWVAGSHPETGEPKGRLRNDAQAVRFVEVSVNGPKSWSLAAELHPDISTAYDAAQDAAARQIVAWLAQHATTRVGPRGAQIQVPVAEIDAVTVRHHTSRAGDPHRHLHLQINARVLAEGRWRALHTVGVRDSIDAINGIGHAAMMTDRAFREALARHGFTLDPGTGEVVELAQFVGPFSARAAQIGRHLDRYEAEWRAANPHAEPGPVLRRVWDRRAWADARPDKVMPRDGAELTARWIGELRELGYRDPRPPVPLVPTRIGSLDRDAAVGEVLGRLAARRSAWNAPDVRGEVEQLIARHGVVADPAVRAELAEDLAARTVAQCVRLLERDGVPEHIRILSSQHVLAVETDISSRLARRADRGREAAVSTSNPQWMDGEGRLDPTQREAVDVLLGDADLVVIEGAAGAGKTTVLAQTRHALNAAGHRLVVVTPTRKAAYAAARQVGTDAFSAAWLAHQHGWRWEATGTWTRLAPGEREPVNGAAYEGPSAAARLRRGDLLLVDEAGMLDQDTARALLTIADAHGARLALVGDRHQLPAIGRGGVLDLAVRHVHPDAHRTLDTVHRFTRIRFADDGTLLTELDVEYADLSLAMRTGENPDAVFDALLARGQIRIHHSDADRLAALADTSAQAAGGGGETVVVADTGEQVAALNAAIRDRLITRGSVSDDAVVGTSAGERIGVGDRVTTRRNDTGLGVANRDQWAVTAVHRTGTITVTGGHGNRVLPADYVRAHVHLAYASTVYGAQGDTTTAAHLVIGEHTGAAAAYVGMTRGREQNVAHLVAANLDDAREQWAMVFARDRADLGPAQAGHLAAREADRYARLRPLDDVLGELGHAWTVEADAQARLSHALRQCELLRKIVAITEQRDAVVPGLERAYENAYADAARSTARLRDLEPVVAARARDVADRLIAVWDSQREPARQAAQRVQRGAGRIGQHRGAVREAREQLQQWSASWRPYLPDMPAEIEQVVRFASWFDDKPRHHAQLDDAARAAAEHAHPEYFAAREAARAADQQKRTAWRRFWGARQHYTEALQHYGNLGFVDDPADLLTRTEQGVAADQATLLRARQTIAALRAEPALRTQPVETVDLARTRWAAERQQQAVQQAARTALAAERQRAALPPGPGRSVDPHIFTRAPGSGIGR